MAGSVGNVASGAAIIDNLLSPYRWAGSSVTFGFTTSASQYGTNYGSNEPSSGFQPLNATQMAATRDAMASWGELINLSITESSAAATADIRIASSSSPATAWGYWPGNSAKAGDIWMGTAGGQYNNPADGNYAKLTFMHEIGHALGLVHPHEPVLTSANSNETPDTPVEAICPCCAGLVHGNGAVKASVFEATPVLEPQAANGNSLDFGANAANNTIDAMTYSIMSYASYPGHNRTGYINGAWDYAQTPMIRDIAAVQYLYGANFQTRSSDTIYSWSATTGEKFINGVGQGAPGGNKVFETLWDGGGRDSINLSNYSSNLNVDLSPGGWVKFNTSQVANLGNGNVAPGNVAMSLLYQGDQRSLIENAVGGSGSDIISGNIADNVLLGSTGNDTLRGNGGHDILAGGTINNELALVNMNRSALISVVPTINGFDGDDALTGASGNDIFVIASGNDVVDGVTGNDTLVIDTALANLSFSGTVSNFTISYGTATITALNIDFVATKEGIFTITASGGSMMSPKMSAAQESISLVYNAGLDRKIDPSGLTFWSDTLNNGGTLNELANNIINADEFAKLFGNPQGMDDMTFVQVLYKNVLDREGEAGGLNYWLNTLAGGTNTRADVLVDFSLSAENRAAVGNGVEMQADGSANPLQLVAITQAQWQDMWA